MEDIRPGAKDSYEVSFKSCKECVFSTGGQYFAAANKNAIQVFDTHTRTELCSVFRGHVGSVLSMHFNRLDSKLHSTGIDGGVFEWNIQEGKRSIDAYQAKDVNFFCSVSDEEGNVIVCGSDNTIKLIVNGVCEGQMKMDVTITQLALTHSGRLLFAGDQHGFVHSFKYPFSSGTLTEITPIMAAQSACGTSEKVKGRVTKMRVSMDDQYLMVSGG